MPDISPDSGQYTNKLIHETSPYLLQHAHNPVNWEPWSSSAFDRAKEENKLVIISIGYSACHWCHVMEHESFEDVEVARLMNDHFICLKVDREERPDVDQMYMDAAQLMVGRGGWPLNAFALPDGRPVYAGTYFQNTAWKGLLKELSFGYKRQPEKFTEYADKLISGIRGLSHIRLPAEPVSFTPDDIEDAYYGISEQLDRTYGGRGNAPKFPMPDIWQFVLRYYHYSKNEEALKAVLLTLDRMAEGGIYDQIGGGFARYSTDREWKVPHFEKMLYDNAQLIHLYAEGYLITGKERYKKIVYETIGFMQRELLSAEGAFYCALDADSEGAEGKFYTWKTREIKDIVDADEWDIVKEYFGIDGKGLWEDGQNILLATEDTEALSAKFNLAPKQLEDIIDKYSRKLYTEREKRIRPGLDHKIILSWNALAIIGLYKAYKTFEEPLFLELADGAFSFLNANMKQGRQLYRSYQNGKAGIPAFLEDYSLYISALIVRYETKFELPDLLEAQLLQQHVSARFYDEKSGFYWFTSEENNELAARKIETSDNVIPSPNAITADNLFRLSVLFNQSSYRTQADHMLQAMMEHIREQSPWYSHWASLLLQFVSPIYEVVFTGEHAVDNMLLFEKHFIPGKIVAGAVRDTSLLPLLQNRVVPGKSLIYVCQNMTCQYPVENVAEALALIS